MTTQQLIHRLILLLIANILTIGCATTPRTPMAANQARVISRGRGFLPTTDVLLFRADEPPPHRYSSELIVPAGKNRLGVYPQNQNSQGIFPELVTNAIARHHMKEIELEVKAGHEYLVHYNMKPTFQAYWNRDILVTDTASNETVAKVSGAAR